ncbi:LPS assembly lipoprotein LptE [Methylophilaceae bacterium]|nr:LPS assembly lipoprotein LptE [Methylophilaceae bacterium]
MQNFLKKLAVLGFILLISACGFQLRGDIQANFDSISISGGTSNFNKTLQRKFRQAGISIKSTSEAEKIVDIIENKFTKTILTLTGTGAVSEYQLDYFVTYRFKSKDGPWNLPVTIEASRIYTYDDSDILAKDEEEKRLVSGMEGQLIKTMATQLSLSK